MKSRQGFSLVEILIAAAVLGIASAALFSFVNNIHKAGSKTQSMSARDDEIASLVETLVQNISLAQADFTPAFTQDANGQYASDDLLTNLPLAWSSQGFTDVASCPSCPGRAGYVIQPMNQMPGLYLVTVRMQNSQLYSGAQNYRDYFFVVTPK